MRERTQEIARLRRGFDDRVRGLLNADSRTKLAELRTNHRSAWADSLATTIGDPAAMAETRAKLLADKREALQHLPNYHAIRQLQQEFSRDYQRLTDHRKDRLQVHAKSWAESLDTFGMQTFEPPFTASDIVEFPDIPGTDPIKSNQSATSPPQGLIINDVTWHDDNTFGEINDFNRWAGCDVSVGIDFESPSSGFLNVAISMKNLVNQIWVRGTDNFGLSSANISLDHHVFVRVLRGDQRVTSFKTVFSQTWVQLEGDDFNFTFPPIPAGPAVFATDFADALHAGEKVQILGGCETVIHTDVTDMDCTARVNMWWQLQKLWVWLS
ncbi:hypothetical protein BTO20_32870 [Mycobacterium dioxanotrophicus]|uniref:Uncharacterized protein n=1 Tax=Mycobacterium dioxanotrophicus TaxID=482462 RepID=A0A1Y0CBT6_9MYCO|nr:hypothetical protein [Mycobacterium dioxanotrophicus]ART72719.1 hypothetical protein BTO20_32870 [Mycobacterium dioxanotrophicus]